MGSDSMSINPIKLIGPWDEGFALDVHTISSTYLGDDVYGHPEFENEYSEMGHLLHLFKYKNVHSGLFDIIELVKPFISSWQSVQEVSFVLPVPSSKPRIYQPAQEIASEIASLLKVGYSDEILQKMSSIESKGLSSSEKQQLQGSIIKTVEATKEHNMLLVDDLYKSGATLTECIRVLREDKKIKKIFVLTMTKTRKG
jgi:predicted amidophosphoribosyltransferase